MLRRCITSDDATPTREEARCGVIFHVINFLETEDPAL